MTIKPSFFIDEPEINNLVLDFPNYTRALSDLILNSEPRYNVGIYGNWGTGKTTLMKNVMEVLLNNDCNCLEFNAWRYALEKRHATYPLMLNLISYLLDRNEIKKNSGNVLQSLKANALRIANGLKFDTSFKIPGILDVNAEVDLSKMIHPSTGKDVSNFNISKPILQEGLETIRELLQFINGPNANSKLKIVVFIDDLDRCVPEKVTEIFESIKVFFDMDGMVFILGLSNEIVEKAINQKYENFGKIFNGRDYLKKIIQIPFALPIWTKSDMLEYVKSVISNHDDDTYKEFFLTNVDLIAKIVELNPREVKRLLNNFILSHQIQKNNPQIDLKKLLILHILSQRWRHFYNQIMLYPASLSEIYMRHNKIEEELQNLPIDEEEIDYNSIFKDKIKNDPYLNDIEDLSGVMNFLQTVWSVISTMKSDEWEFYRRATIVEPEINVVKESRTKPVKSLQDIKLNNFKPNPDEKPGEPIIFWKHGGTPEQGRMPSTLSETLEAHANNYGIIKFQYQVPINFGPSKTSHTSDLILHIQIDGVEYGTSSRLGNVNNALLKSEFFSVENLLPGRHFLTLRPELPEDAGQYLSNWGGIVCFYH